MRPTINSINALIVAVTGGYSIYTAFRVLKAYKKKQAVNLKIIKYLTKFGIYRSLAVGIATTVISIIMNLMGITVGNMVATVVKRYFVSYMKKQNSLYILEELSL